MHNTTAMNINYFVHFNDLQLLRHECKFDSLRISIHVRPAWLKGRGVMVKLQQCQNTDSTIGSKVTGHFMVRWIQVFIIPYASYKLKRPHVTGKNVRSRPK